MNTSRISTLEHRYDSAIPTSTSGWIFPNTSETDIVSIQASGPVNALHCASRSSDGTCVEMYVGGQFQSLQSISSSGHKGPRITTDLALAVRCCITHLRTHLNHDA